MRRSKKQDSESKRAPREAPQPSSDAAAESAAGTEGAAEASEDEAAADRAPTAADPPATELPLADDSKRRAPAPGDASADPKPSRGDAKGDEAKDGDGKKRERRLSRFRFAKKKDMPGGLWLKCESCAEVVFRKDLEERGRVCPACDFHFTVPGRERVEMTLDKGTWQEHFAELTALDRLAFVDSGPYDEKLARAVQRTHQNEALISGTGAIHGRKVVLAVLDFGFMGGSMGEVVGEKIALAADLARERCEPLVLFTSSGGARMHEGVLSLMQMAKTSAALQSLNEAGGFSICVMTHPTTGGVTASFASVTDLVLAEPGALIGFAGPRVIATTLRQELPPGFQRAEFLLQKGMIDAIVERSAMREQLARLLAYAAGGFA